MQYVQTIASRGEISAISTNFACDKSRCLEDSMMAAVPTNPVQYLLDRTLISDQVYRYMKGLDTRDFALVQSALARPFRMQAAQLGIDKELYPEDYTVMGPERFLPGFDVTVHMSTNHLVTIDGDAAHVETKLYACHYIQEEGVGERRNIGGNRTPAVHMHCNKQMPWEGWLTRQPDGGWLFHHIRMGTFASEGDVRAFDISLRRSGHMPAA